MFYALSGDTYKCSCGKVYEYVEDEAEGGGWYPKNKVNKI